MPSATRLTTGLSLLLAALLLGACGGDDSDTTARQGLLPAGTDTVVEGERDAIGPGEGRYRARLNEICLASERALARAELLEFGKPGPDNPPPDRAELQRFYDEVVVPTRQGQLETMQRVPGGEARAAEVEAYFAAFLAAVRELGADLALIKEPGVEEAAFADAVAAADAAGLERCGSGGERKADSVAENGDAGEPGSDPDGDGIGAPGE